MGCTEGRHFSNSVVFNCYYVNPRHGQWMAYTCPYYQLCYNSIIYSTILLKNICCITLSICLIILILFLECAGMYMYLFLLLRAVTSQSRALSMCFLLRQPPHPPPLFRSRTPEASWTRTRTWTSTPPPFLARQLGKEKLSPQVRLHPPCSAALLPRGALSQSEFCRCRFPEPHHLLRVL